MAHDPEGVVGLKALGKKYRLYFGIRAEKAVEEYYDLPFFKAIKQIMPDLTLEDMADEAKVAEESSKILFTNIAKLFEFALLKFQPDIEEAEVEDVIDSIGLTRTTEIIGKSLAAVFKDEEGSEGGNANPPKASRKKPTGSRSK